MWYLDILRLLGRYYIGDHLPMTEKGHFQRRSPAICTGFIMVIVMLFSMIFTQSARASLIRDTELEAALLHVARPMAEEAGLNPDNLQIRIIINSDYNAFVTADEIIYVYSGLIMKAENMLEVAGVMAHEIGHIAAGHVQQRHGVIKDASVATILGAVAAVALTASGNADAAVGVLAGSTDQTNRIVLARSRQDEGVADEYAIRLMEHQGYSVAPMAERMRQLGSQRLLPENRQSEYYQTHPGALERSAVFQDHVNNHETGDVDEPEWMTQIHDRIKAKLAGWSSPPKTVLVSIIGETGVNTEYKRAIALHKLSDLNAAVDIMRDLVNQYPEDAYFQEFLGDLLLKSGDPVAAAEAYEKSLSLLPPHINAGQIELSLGRAYLAINDADAIEKAIVVLEQANRHEPDWAFVKRQLGIGLGRAGRFAAADLILAEEAMMRGQQDLAKQLAERVTKNPDATSYQQQLANDILLEIDL